RLPASHRHRPERIERRDLDEGAGVSLTRRDWLKALGSAALLPSRFRGVLPASGLPIRQAPTTSLFREGLLAGFRWRFHLVHANDPAKDLGWGQGRRVDTVGRL